MRKELLKRVIVADRHKKGLAVLLSLALAATTFSAAPSSEAAAKTTPSLSAKKKTLYYNGTKKFTLKVKKNKAKKIVKTTWKTSNKKVAAISKKKKTSVVVTAKKKGTAKITATVSYKAGSKTKKVKLTCKVTSKKKSGNTDNSNTDSNTTSTPAPGVNTTPTPTPGGNTTPAPTEGGNATPTPGANATPTPTPTQGGNVAPAPAEGSDETLEGNGDSGENGVTSRKYSLKEKNSKVTFYVEALTNANLFVDLNQGGNYFTTSTEPGAWIVPFNESTQINMQRNDESFNNLQQGKKYTIIVTRKDNKDKTDYEIVIKSTDTDTPYVTVTAQNSVLTGNVSACLKVVEGKIKMYSDTVPKPAKPAPADGSLETIEGEGIESMEYSMKEKNSTVTFYVETLDETLVYIDLNQEDKHINLDTQKKAWAVPAGTAENISTEIKEIGPEYIIDSNFNNFQPGENYTFIVTRKDYVEANKDKTDYEFVIKNTETDATYVKFTAKNTTLTGDVSAHLVVWGNIKMYSDTVPTPNHGTDRTKLYSLSDVNNDPPTDYVIPDGLVREAKDKAYEEYFPKNSIQTVKVEMDESNLNYMLQHAGDKPSVMTNSVKIGDSVEVGYAGIKTKGNYTLSSTNKSDSDRFSFTLNFGKYIKKKQYGAKQNFYGCSKISFNNCYFDKTIMKEYNAMRLMDEMGIPTPQYSLAKLYINDKYYGVYFMVEAMDSAIIERYKDATSKEVSDYLVKPSYTNMYYGFEPELEACLENNEFTMEKLNQAGLLGQDENGDYYANEWLWENYGGIWEDDYDTLQDVAKMLPTVLTWNRKIQLLSDRKDFDGKTIDVNSTKYLELLESLMDTDEAVKYFATHSFLVQMDNMFTWGQNYGLYVGEDGKSLFVPWDYDLAWGTAIWNEGHITAEQSANWDIDKMYPDNFEVYDENGMKTYGAMEIADVYSRAPLFNVIWQNDSLKKKYHDYMEDCAKLVSLGGTLSDGTTVEPARFATTIQELYSEVTKAAEGKLAKNVYYVGDIEQPKGTVEGIPELKKLIARRAVSVWLQTHGIEATVTGYDCDILKLGANFVYDKNTDRPTVKGNLAVVDEGTGIFATATYSNDNDAAWIKAQQLTSGKEYSKISETVTNPLVYKIELANADKASDYKLYVPSSKGEDAKIYLYSADDSNTLQELTGAEKIDNIYCVTGADLTYIVIG